MAVTAGFTVEGRLFKGVVSAWLVVQDEAYWTFTRRELCGRALDSFKYRMVEFRLSPPDYVCDVDALWVHVPSGALEKAVKGLRAGQEVRVEVRDGRFRIGAFEVGEVIEEREIEDFVLEYFKPPELHPRPDAQLRVASAEFRRIVRGAVGVKPLKALGEAFVGLRVRGSEVSAIFFDERVSRIDWEWREPWQISSSGDASSIYDLYLFNSVILGLTDGLEIKFQNQGPMELSYEGMDFSVRFILSSYIRDETVKRFSELLGKPKPVRRQVWRFDPNRIKLLERTLRAISALTDEIRIGMTGEDMWVYWLLPWAESTGYFRVPKARFYEYEAPAERVSGVFSVSELASQLRDAEELTCLLDESALIFEVKGAKIAPREVRSLEVVKGIEVPEVQGEEFFSGASTVLGDVLEDAESAGENWIVLASTPFEIEAVGRNAIYYRASLPLDSFKTVTEDLVVISSGWFKPLGAFFANAPEVMFVGVQDDNIYLRGENDLGELRVLAPQPRREILEEYKKITKPPPAPKPPEVKPLAPALAPPVSMPPPKPLPTEDEIRKRILDHLTDVVRTTWFAIKDDLAAFFKETDWARQKELWEKAETVLDGLVAAGRVRYEPEGVYVIVLPAYLVPPAPPAPTPVRPPPTKELSGEEVSRLEESFKATLTRELGVAPEKALDEFWDLLDVSRRLPYDEAARRVEELARRVVSRLLSPELVWEVKKWRMIGLSEEYISRELKIPLETVKRALR